MGCSKRTEGAAALCPECRATRGYAKRYDFQREPWDTSRETRPDIAKPRYGDPRSSMRIVILAAVTLGTVMVFVLLLLVRLNADLDALREQVATDLDETAERLQRETDQSRALTADLEETNGQLQREADRSAALTAGLQSASARLEAKAAETVDLHAELEARTGQLATERSENETLTASLAASGALLESVTAEKAGLEADLEAAARQLADSADAYVTLAQAGGSVADLNEARDRLVDEIAALRSEISDLEERRRPLIVASHTTGFLCTGSMEPKITCLDSATWLDNYNPADVVVGSVISFAAPPECQLGNAHVAHRVLNTREEGGVYWYWPKGDALADADGCWVPHTRVYSYLVELSKDAYPENSGLRERVNAATAERDATYARFRAAEAVYTQRHQQFCGHAPDACRLDAAGLAELDGLYSEMLRLYWLHQDAYSAWNDVYWEALNG